MSSSPTTSAERDFLWKGRTGPFTIQLAPGVFPPSATSRALADQLDIREGETVIDVGCGTGVLSFVALRLGADRAYGVDIVEESIPIARANAERMGLADRADFRAGNLFDPVRDVRADVIIGDVSGIPDELAAETDWFPGGHAGGPTGAEVPVAMLESMGDCLRPGGRLYLPTATIQDESSVIAAAKRIFGASNLVNLGEREFPLPALVARSKAVARMVTDGFVRLRQRGSRLLWRLAIWRCVRT